MTAERCTIHGTRCPLGSHTRDDDSFFGPDDRRLYGRDYDQACDDDAEAMCGVREP